MFSNSFSGLENILSHLIWKLKQLNRLWKVIAEISYKDKLNFHIRVKSHSLKTSLY